MPNDDGYKYLLTTRDVQSGISEAQPIKSKSASDVAQGFKDIFKRGVVKPNFKYIYTDNNDFKGEVKTSLEKKDIMVKNTLKDRKNQNAVVEAFNGLIGEKVIGRQNMRELKSGKVDKDWVDDIKPFIKTYNKVKKHNEPIDAPKIKDFIDGKVTIQKNEQIFKVGDIVHPRLDAPVSSSDGVKIYGKFRAGDLRYNKDRFAIMKVNVYPGQPIRYMVKNLETGKELWNVSYLGDELKVYPPDNNVQVEEAKKPEPKKKGVVLPFESIGERLRRRKDDHEFTVQ
jgi:hypothetical protein